MHQSNHSSQEFYLYNGLSFHTMADITVMLLCQIFCPSSRLTQQYKKKLFNYHSVSSINIFRNCSAFYANTLFSYYVLVYKSSVQYVRYPLIYFPLVVIPRPLTYTIAKINIQIWKDLVKYFWNCAAEKLTFHISPISVTLEKVQGHQMSPRLPVLHIKNH